jgi:hypothetical protein
MREGSWSNICTDTCIICGEKIPFDPDMPDYICSTRCLNTIPPIPATELFESVGDAFKKMRRVYPVGRADYVTNKFRPTVKHLEDYFSYLAEKAENG